MKHIIYLLCIALCYYYYFLFSKIELNHLSNLKIRINRIKRKFQKLFKDHLTVAVNST